MVPVFTAQELIPTVEDFEKVISAKFSYNTAENKFKKGTDGSRRKRSNPCKTGRTACTYRVCPWRLLACRNEKTVQNFY